MRIVFFRRRRRKPYVTYLLILTNILIYLFTSLDNASTETSSEWIETLAYVPTLGRYPRQWYRVFSSMFTHADIFHIFFNMYFLYIFGREVEVKLGHSKYFLLYLLSGLGAIAFYTAFIPVSGSIGLVIPIVGASGAISGILASHMFMFPQRKLAAWVFPLPPVVIPSSYYLLLWFATQVGYGYARFETGTAFFAHVGGFVAGIMLLYLLGRTRRHPSEVIGLGRSTRIVLSFLILTVTIGAVYSCFTARYLSGVYVFRIQTTRNGYVSQDQAVYTTFENKTVSPSLGDPRVIFNRMVWAKLIQYRPSYADNNFKIATNVFPPDWTLPLHLIIEGSIKYDPFQVLEFFEGKIVTDVIITDQFGRLKGIERDVEYLVSLSSEEVAGNVKTVLIMPLALISILVGLVSLVVTLTKSDELVARELYSDVWSLVPV